MKFLIIVALALYILSPADAFPGPIDDIIILLMGVGALKGLSSRGR